MSITTQAIKRICYLNTVKKEKEKMPELHFSVYPASQNMENKVIKK